MHKPNHSRTIWICVGLVLVFVLCSFSLLLPVQESDAKDVYMEVGYVPLDDGVKLAYNLYRPSKEGQFPLLLEYNPYWGGGQSLSPQIIDFLRNGYAVMGVNIRGTGCSEGVFEVFLKLEEEGKDGAQVVEWAAQQPWCTGAVGMFGNSYPGIIQFAVAAQHPAHLKALSAGGLSSDIYSDVSYPGGIMNTMFAWWTYWAQPFVVQMGLKKRAEIGEDPDCPTHREGRRRSRSWEHLVKHPLRDEFWKVRAAEVFAARVDIPALMIQGWQDEQVPARGAVRLSENVKGPKKLILSNGGHRVYSRLWPKMGIETIRWFDRWLKGIDNGIDQEPPVTIWFETQYPEWEGEEKEVKPGWVDTFSDWPIPETSQQKLYLTANRKLATNHPEGEEDTGELTYFYPYSTEIPYTNESFDIAPPPLGSIHYQTPPMEEDLAIIGTAVVTLFLSSELEDTDFMAVLHDIDSEGNTLFVQRGYMRASHRRIDRSRSKLHDPYFSHDREELMKPGSVYEIKVPFYPVAHVFRKGHKIELGIMTPPTIPLPNWGFLIKNSPGMNTIHHSPEYSSSLMLPVIPGLKAKAPAPALGSLPFQPYRKAQDPNPWQLRK